MEHNDLASQNLLAADSLSCKICRRKKVKCDKKHPCSSCQKSNLDCVFPQGRRRPTHGRTSRDTELLHRLKHLESELHALRTTVVHKSGDDQTKDSSPASPRRSPQGPTPELTTDNETNDTIVESVVADFGRLDIRKGRSRYTSNALWASLSQEIADMQTLLDEDTSEDDGPSPPRFQMPSTSWPGHSGFLLGLGSNDFTSSALHPPKAQMLQLWSVFEQNVIPVVKVFHGSTTKSLFEAAANGTETISPVNEPVLFSIYYAAVVSLSSKKCEALFGESQSRLMRKYRKSLELSLWRVDFLNSSSFAVLQAFILFTICTRRHDDTRLVVSWCATAIRTAQFLGLHRDSTNFGLDPFQTEMRRRVWWHLVLLDADSSRDHGIDPLLKECSFDTQMPLNIDDDDIYPDMQSPPLQRQGFTDMTNCIARLETSLVSCRLSYNLPRKDVHHGNRILRTIGDKEKLIKELQSHLDECYLQHCDYSKPLQFATAVYIRSACAMLWSIIYHPLQRHPEPISRDMHDRLFSSMVEVVENTRLLEHNPVTEHWGWYFHNDVQWTAIAYVLHELLTRAPGPSVTRAWRVVYAARQQWDADSSPLQKGMLWRTVRTMTAKAGLFDEIEGAGDVPNVMPQGSTVGRNFFDNQEVSPLSLLNNLQCENQQPAMSIQTSAESGGRQIADDPWLLLEDSLVPLQPEVPITAYDFSKKPASAHLGTVMMDLSCPDTVDAHQNTWWSLLDDPGRSQWIA